MSYRLGIGDWFSPDCQPGAADCVPHWYCYIPGMATPDCLASLTQGVKTIVGDTASAAGGVVGAAVSGTVQGAVSAVTGGGSGSGASLCSQSIAPPLCDSTVLIGGVVAIVAVLFLFRR